MQTLLRTREFLVKTMKLPWLPAHNLITVSKNESRKNKEITFENISVFYIIFCKFSWKLGPRDYIEAWRFLKMRKLKNFVTIKVVLETKVLFLRVILLMERKFLITSLGLILIKN